MPFISRQQQVMDNGRGRGGSSPRRVLLSGHDSQGLWMWKTAEEKGFGWELWESSEVGQIEHSMHITAGLVLGKCHTAKVCFWGACAPHYQRNNVVMLPLALCSALYSKILVSTALCRQCSCPPLPRSSLGSITTVQSTVRVHQN